MQKRTLGLIAAWGLILGGIALLVFAIYMRPVEEADWNLILVNRWNEVPEEYSVELMGLTNGEQIDEKIYPYLQAMFDAARAENIYPVVRDGYRTDEEQQQIMHDKVQTYMDEGLPEALAEIKAYVWVAHPGTSEHELGIAVDINADSDFCTDQEVYDWLKENAHEYGFILRYPEGKELLTGIGYEPWHYRYVGEDVAAEIYEKELCLEEYVYSAYWE